MKTLHLIRPTPYALRHTPYALRPTPYAIRPTPYVIPHMKNINLVRWLVVKVRI